MYDWGLSGPILAFSGGTRLLRDRGRAEKSNPYYLLYRAYRSLKQPEKAAGALQQFKRLKAQGS